MEDMEEAENTLAKEIAAQVKIISFYVEVKTKFTTYLINQGGKYLVECESYRLPDFMPDRGIFGDASKLNVDIETGQITNWKKPSLEEIADFIELSNKHPHSLSW